MSLSNNLERRCGWLAFPGFLRYFAIFDAMVYLLTVFRPGLGHVLLLDWDRVWAGEIWRVVTGLFAGSGFGVATPLGVVFKFFVVMITFMISDALEGAWGPFKLSLFCYVGVIGAVAATLVQPWTGGMLGLFFYESAFFAFATVFPKVEFRLFFVLPVQVRFLAIIAAIPLLWTGFSSLSWWGVLLLAFGNYLIWAGIPALRGKGREVQALGRRRKFQSAANAAGRTALYQCAVCHRTDASDPDLEFRVGADGIDYCDEHLPK